MTLTELAKEANVSKGYLSEIETGEGETRLSGQKLYSIADALGVTMTDLLGRKLILEHGGAIPQSLREFAEAHKLPEADVQMLAGIQFRGDRPQTEERWAHIYSAIRSSEWMDESGA
jgi:transcriptional regulator with XRE-family HTH domain